MSRYVIAGATGRVGSAVADELIGQGRSTDVVVRDPARGGAWSGRGARVAVGSLADPEFLSWTLDGAAGFFALLPEDPSVADFHGHRRRMADAVAVAVERARVPHVVVQSALAACLSDRNGPGKDLHHLEGALRATGAKLSIHRACYFQENVGAAIAPATQAGIFPS